MNKIILTILSALKYLLPFKSMVESDHLVAPFHEIMSHLQITRIGDLFRRSCVVVYDPNNLCHYLNLLISSTNIATSFNEIAGPIGKLNSWLAMYSVIGNDMSFHSL